MSETVTLTIDGRTVTVAPGTTVLDACRTAGVEQPTICGDGPIPAPGVCRVCVVEIEGSRPLVASCVRTAEDGMVVRTDTERVGRARRGVLELLGSSVALDRAGLEPWMDRYGVRPGRHGDGATHAVRAPTLDNDLYVRDLARCVLCYRCVEACGAAAQHTFAITVAERGFEATIAVEHDRPLTDSACVFCGNCVAVCPTGALVSRSEHALREAGAWDPGAQTVTTTVCSYCGVGCNLELRIQDGRIVDVRSPAGHDVTEGSLCIKGRFGYGYVHEVEADLRTPIDDLLAAD